MSKSIRTKKMRASIGASALTVAACVAVGQSAVTPAGVVFALKSPTDTPTWDSPAGFLPAPNDQPYCDSMEYFNYFPANVKAIADNQSQQIIEDTAWTGANNDGISMTFKTVTSSDSPNLGFPTPVVGPSKSDSDNLRLSTIGIIMNGVSPPTYVQPAVADVILSEPLFYSQWVFTDLDQPKEGFDLYPTWSSANPQFQHYGMFGPNNDDPDNPLPADKVGWSFETDLADPPVTNPTDRDHVGFYSKRSKNVDGMDLPGRFQVDFFGPITQIRMQRYGSGGSGFATGAGCPPIGIAKQSTAPVWDAATQKFTVQYKMKVINNLPDQAKLDAVVAAAKADAYQSRVVGDAPVAIPIEGLQVTDKLKLDGFASAEITNIVGTNVTVNPDYDGVGDINLLTGSDTLPAGKDGEIVVDVAYTADFTSPDWNDCDFQTTNQSEVKGIAAGVTVTDLSDNGGDPKPAADNGTGGTDDPTPVAFGPLKCQVGLAKDIVEGSTVNNEDGTYTTTYTFKVGNYGDVNLTNFVLDDDLDAAYGDAYVSSSITDDKCNALNATGGLAPDQFCEIKLDVIFKPITGILKEWINQASIVASVGPDPDSPVTTTDQSQDGVEPDPDGDDDPTNNTKPTPNQITADIGLSKVVTDGPINNGDGTYDVTYSLVATNFGFAFLDKIVVNDDLKNTFGDALVSYETDDQCASATLPTKGDSCEVIVNVTFRPGTQLHWENSADVTGNAGGTDVTDVSQDGVDPDPDKDGDPGNNSDPTPVDVTSDPSIEIVKSMTTAETQTIEDDGTNIVEYKLVVTNTGNVQLSDIVVTDDLEATFGKDRLVSGGITENGCEGVTLLSAEQEGGPGTCTVTVVATVRPGADLGPDTNIANVTGTAPDGTGVEDESNPVDVRWIEPTEPTPPSTTIPNPKPGGKFGSSLGLAAILFLLGGAMLAVTRRRETSVA